MEQKILKTTLQIVGMTCNSCEVRIDNKLRKLKGVIEAKANLAKSSVSIKYDSNVISMKQIETAIKEAGYFVDDTKKLTVSQIIGIAILLFAVFWIINNTIGFNFLPQVSQNMGFGILFVVGLITSLHCVVMCGGINISQCVSKSATEPKAPVSKTEKLKPSLMYNMGRVVSYTIIGGVVGALGSLISFSGMAKGVVALISGLFMVVMGINMLNIFPGLKKFIPRLPKKLTSKKTGASRNRGPFVVGLLNGFMPCGPLQTMQVYALGTGSFLAGAGAMFFFSLGTVPLMFGLGALSSILSSRFTKNMMRVGAVLVMILGIIMFSRGLNLSGVSFAQAPSVSVGNVSTVEGNLQLVTTNLQPNSYEPITVQKGVPVKWTVKADAKNITGCNETMTVPEYGITKKLVAGDNIIEFTPTRAGTVKYTCWMGMISSTITVTDNAGSPAPNGVQVTNPPSNSSATGIKVAKIVNNKQEITVDVTSNGYSPQAYVVQKGVQLKIKFNVIELTGCNSTVVFPEFQGQLSLSTEKETPWLTPTQDITFHCGMNMLHGYVKVVDDLKNIDLQAIKNELASKIPAQSNAGGGGCCG